MSMEGNNHPSSVNLKSLVHCHYKPGEKCHPRQHGHSGKPKCVRVQDVGAREH